MINEGAATQRLEGWFAERFGGTAVATGSGSQALLLALRSVEVRPTSEVIVPTYVCAEVLAVIEATGATPVLADVGEDYLLDPEAAAAAVGPRTRAIVLPYLMGIEPNLAPFRALGVPIIEDLAQWLGPASRPQGDLQVFSFEATKFAAGGEGGLVLTRDGKLGAKLRSAKLMNKGAYKLNLFPLSDLQATLVLSQLERVDRALELRQQLALRYLDRLSGVPCDLPHRLCGRSLFFRFPIRLPAGQEVDSIILAFSRAGVAVRRPVDRLLHHVRSSSRSFPMADGLFASTISIPLYPALSELDHQAVVAATQEVLGVVPHN